MFETPDQAPEAKSGTIAENPIAREIYFKPGKSQVAAIKGKITASDLGVKFSHREGAFEEGVPGTYSDLRAFTLYVLGVYSRFAGQEFNEANPKDSLKFTSTIYRAPSDQIYFRLKGVKDVRTRPDLSGFWAVGDYRTLRNFCDTQSYRNSVGYKRIAICYCVELQEVIEIVINRRIEYGMAEAISVSTSTPRDPRRISGLCDLSTCFWGFRFAGDFVEVDEIKGKPCEPFSGKKEWGFAPVFQCGVCKAGGKSPELFAQLAELQATVDHYVDEQIAWAKSVGAGNEEPEHGPSKPEVQAHTHRAAYSTGFEPDDRFPSTAPNSDDNLDLPF